MALPAFADADARPPARCREVGSRHDQARIARHQAPRRHPLLRARSRAVAAVLHRQARLRRDLAVSSPELEQQGRQKSACFQAGNVLVVCSSPVGEGGRAARFLREAPRRRRHADLRGRGHRAARSRLLEERGGTPIDDIQTFTRRRRHAAPVLDHDAVRRHHVPLPRAPRLPRAVPRRGAVTPGGGTNKFGFEDIDHVTSNFQTMKPMLLWLEHVLGFEQLWEVAFHTSDVDPKRKTGSGLKSIVMWDPAVEREVREQRAVAAVLQELADQHLQRGAPRRRRPARRADGRRHPHRGARAARAAASSSCRRRARYYDMLPERIEKSGIKQIDEDIDDAARARDPRRRRPRPRVHAADLPQGVGGPLRRSERGPVLLRDHPAQGRPRLRRRQLPRAVREHRARAAASRGRA